jgi:DNA-binding CsgD family transcriptional regulator
MPARRRLTSVHVTPREAEVLHFLAQGLGNAEIAVTLGMSTRSVKGHINRVANKLHVNSDQTGHRILLARYWQYPIFRVGAGWNDHPSKA